MSRLKKLLVLTLLLAGVVVAGIACAGPDRTDHNKHSSDDHGRGCGH